jgi:predicted peptidase
MRHTAGGLAEVIRVFGDWFPAVALFPQAAAGENWVGRNADRVTMQIEATLREFGGDPDRVYLTGQSMGGEGVYYLALQHPDRFAALVVSCASPFTPPWRLEELGRAPVDRGPAAFDSVAATLMDLPLWIFHGAEDQVVQASEAREVVRALAAIGAEPRYTEYPEQGHDACGRAFFEESLWPWVFEQRRPPSG